MKTTRMRVAAIATACALVGAGAGIAGSTAATGKSKSGPAATTKAHQGGAERGGPGGPGFGRRGGFGPHGGPVVHAEAVVLNKAGTGYVTQKMDEGLVKSVSGNDVVITEGTPAVPYRDVTVTVPAGATVVRNGKPAAVTDLKAGDRVHVVSSSDGTELFAADATFRPMDGPGDRGHHGPGGDDDGPPPAAAPAPPVAP